MDSARHKQAVPTSVRARRIGIPLVAVVALGTGIALTAGDDPAPDPIAVASSDPTEVTARPGSADVSRAGQRDGPSQRPAPSPGPRRSAEQVQRDPVPVQEPVQREPVQRDPVQRWLTADLNVWAGPGEDNELLTVLEEGTTVQATGAVTGDWAQIVRGDGVAWVNAAYLVAEKPAEPPAVQQSGQQESGQQGSGQQGSGQQGSGQQGSGAAGTGAAEPVSAAACPDGSSVESGLTANTVAVYRSVCAAFPEVSTWGGLRPGDDGDHGTGQALDIMVGSSTLGDAIADYVQAHASELGVSEILWSQHIWSVQRSSEGWRPMEDRGSTTANHYDHVHVSVY